MSATTYAWLVLAFPLAGSILIGLTWRWLPGRTAGVIGTSAIALAFLCAIGALVQLQAEPAEARHLADTLYDYAGAAGIPFDLGIFVDPLSVYMILRGPRVSMLIHLLLAYMWSATRATGASSPTSTSSSSRCCS